MISMAGVIGSNAANYGAGSSTTLLITTSATANAGDLVTVAIALPLTTTVTLAVTDSRGNTYSLVASPGARTRVFSSLLTTALQIGDTITVTATLNNFRGIAAQAVRWTGVDATTPIDRDYAVGFSSPFGSRAGETWAFTTYAGLPRYANEVLFGCHGVAADNPLGAGPVYGAETGVSVPSGVTLLPAVGNAYDASYILDVVLHSWYAPGPAVGASQSIAWTWSPIPPNYAVMENWWGLLVPDQSDPGGGSGGGGAGSGGGEDMMPTAGVTTSATGGDCSTTAGVSTGDDCATTGGVSSPISGCD